MELGLVGLGKMGANMAERLVKAGHKVVGFARTPETVQEAARRGVTPSTSLSDLVSQLARPRTIWLMIPSGAPVDDALSELKGMLSAGDVVVDGGNSYYRDTLRRAPAMESSGIRYVDCGTSGGIWGLSQGYSLMIGGDPTVIERLRPIFESLAPSPTSGWGRVGPAGSGHFVKMVHNGIEYGLMQSYAEGFHVLREKEEFGLDLARVAEIWRFGSVVRSWLLDLTAEALTENPGLSGIAPYVVDSGEGRWTLQEGLDLDVPTPVIAISLMERLASREQVSFAHQLLAVMRQKFGGHAVKKEG